MSSDFSTGIGLDRIKVWVTDQKLIIEQDGLALQTINIPLRKVPDLLWAIGLELQKKGVEV